MRDGADFAMNVGYCWGKCVWCGFVERALEWNYSPVHRDMKAGRFAP